MVDVIIYPRLKINGSWAKTWMSDYIPYKTTDVIIHPFLNAGETTLLKRAPMNGTESYLCIFISVYSIQMVPIGTMY